MVPLQTLIDWLRQFAPLELAEDWDNVGLLIGNSQANVSSVLTCLTLTSNVADEAIAAKAQLIVSHHPVLFRAVQTLTNETPEGAMLLKLIQAGIAVYSPHTAYDSAADGINQQLAELLQLADVQPLRVHATSTETQTAGSGRFGRLPQAGTLSDVIDQVKSTLGIRQLQFVGDLTRPVRTIGIACGAAAEFLRDAKRLGCDALLTGEARFHACLEAEVADIALILPGHFATERLGAERLATVIGQSFPTLIVRASVADTDPVQFA